MRQDPALLPPGTKTTFCLHVFFTTWRYRI